MRLELRVSGGVAGLARPPVEVDTGEREDGPELEALAAQVAAETPADAGGADRFQYDLRIDDRAVRLHEGALTPAAADLVGRLLSRRR
jgi:hypothetical protein